MKIISNHEYIRLRDVGDEPIFFGMNGLLCGMIIYHREQYWLHTSDRKILGSGFTTASGAVEYGQSLGYNFYVEVKV